MKLTPKKLQYLICIKRFENSGRLISELAEYFDVSKGAVSQLIDDYEKNGMITRGSDGAVELSEKAEALAAELSELHGKLCDFFGGLPDMTAELADKAALQYLCYMPPQAVDSLLFKLGEKEKLLAARWDVKPGQGIGSAIADGSYELPFDVYKAGRSDLSMGDRGFAKPAVLTVTGGEGIITLKPKTIRYRSLVGKLLRGRLSKLSCAFDGDYVKLDFKNGGYVVPLYYLHDFSRAPDGTLCALLRIKAEVGKCAAYMPASEADIIFKFK